MKKKIDKEGRRKGFYFSTCLLKTSQSQRERQKTRLPVSAGKKKDQLSLQTISQIILDT